MRFADRYLGLLAATLAFGAVVATAEGMDWPVTAAFGGVAAVALGVAAARAAAAPRVLVVGDPRSAPVIRLGDDIDGAGYATRSCPGPAARPCPVLEGKPCPIPGHPVAAVIVGTGRPVPPCGTALRIPAFMMAGAGAPVGESSAGVVGPAPELGSLRSALGAGSSTSRAHASASRTSFTQR